MAMKKLTNLIPLIMITLILIIMAGCSGGGSESDSANVNPETSDKAGVAITATTYADASTIKIFIDSETENGYIIAENGATLSPGTKVKFGIKVEGGSYPVEKVLVSDGGGYQLKAAYNKDLDLYLCNYSVSDTEKLIPVVIQVVHPNGQASKEKFVFSTVVGAKSNELVRDGLGILVGSDILASAAGMQLSGITINSLKPKAGHATGIMEADLGLPIPVVLGLADGLKGTETDAVSPTLKLVIPVFNNLLKIPLDMGIKSMLLDEMLGGMAGSFGADMSGLNLATKPLYLDINGIPASTTSSMAALSLGLFMSQGADPVVFPAGVTLYNNTDLNPGIDFSKSADDPSAMEISLSQANMSQFVGEMLNGNVVVGAIGIPAAVPNYAGVTPAVDQEMRISIKKEGVIFDFKTDAPLIIINDLRIEYLENKVPKWMMSLDLAFKLYAGSHQAINPDTKINESFLDIYLSLVPEYSHCAVLKDDMGITMFDKSAFVGLLVGGLKEMLPSDNPDKGELQLSIGTDSFGLTLSDASAISDSGRCFLSMTTEAADLSKAGLCFINTATF
jgi:hypothetical protein